MVTEAPPPGQRAPLESGCAAVTASRPQTAVAFIVRDKFAWALASLRRLYALAGEPFTLYFVDGVYPRETRAGLERFLADKPNVVWIQAHRFLYSNEALNLVAGRIAEPYLFLLQNDVLIGRDALKRLLESARLLGADLVAPVILDTDSGVPAIHRDTAEPVMIVQEGERVFVARGAPAEWRDGRQRVYHFETHSLLITSEALRSVCPLPPISVHEHIDMAVALWRQGRSMHRDPRVRVLFMDAPPLALRDYECPFFRFRWDAARAKQSDDYVRSRWRLADLFDVMPFIGRQQLALRPEAVLTRYDSVFEPDLWPEEIAAA